MEDPELTLRRSQRDEILKAVSAIQRQLQQLSGKPDWRALWVIGTNLTIIQTTVTQLPSSAN